MTNQAGFTPIVAAPRRWDVLGNFMVEQGYKSFVEVGCKEGRTTGHILHNVPESTVIAIDPWIVMPQTADATAETYEKWNFAEIEAEFWKNVGDAKDRCEMLRETSEQAAFHIMERHPPTSDLVFIDARHDYDSVLEDIRLWWPLVRDGGILAGHDFNHQWPGVERAVARSFNLLDIGVASDSVWFIIKRDIGQLRAL
jgi:predicted O-methyltransferase YrrM